MSDETTRGASGERVAGFITEIYIIIMLTAFPLYTGFEGYANIAKSKYLFFAVATVMWILALIIPPVAAAIKARELSLPRWSEIKSALSPARIAVTAFVIAACLSAALSPYGSYVLTGSGRREGLFTMLLYAAVFFGVSFTGRLKKEFIYLFAASVSVCCVIAIIQLFGKNPFGLYPGSLNYFGSGVHYSGKYLGTIGNTNLLAALLCLAAPLFTACFITGEGRRSALLLVPAWLGVFVIIASRSSGGTVALVVAALVSVPVLLTSEPRIVRALIAAGALITALALGLAYTPADITEGTGVSFSIGTAVWGLLICVCLLSLAFVLARRRLGLRLPEPPKLRKWFLILTVSAVFVCFLVVYFWQGDEGTVYEFSRVLHGDIRDEFGSSRIRIWREVLAVVPERLLFGGGPDTLSLRIDVQFTRYDSATGETLRSFADNAHNEYLGYLANLGIFGLITYLAAILASVLTWLKNLGRPGFCALGCALVCYWAQSFFGIGLSITAPFLWLFWGLLESGKAEYPEGKPLYPEMGQFLSVFGENK